MKSFIQILGLIMVLSLFGCDKKSPEAKFWAWFVKHSVEYESFETNPDELIHKLSTQLIKYKGGLAVEVSKEENGIRELTISPDGVKELFPDVERLVSNAPKIEGWQIVAFRQKAPKGFSLKAGELVLDPAEMYFYPLIENHHLDVIVYIKDLDEHDINAVTYYGLVVIDNLLGEYDCVMKVRSYDFHELPPEEERKDLYPLQQLSEYVNKFHSK